VQQHEHATAVALQHHVDEIAVDIGRLRRHPACAPDSSLGHLADRIAHHVESLDTILQPTAHDFYLEHLAIAGSDADALCLTEALHRVDRRRGHLRVVLAEPNR
jgi:hypothetical protein